MASSKSSWADEADTDSSDDESNVQPSKLQKWSNMQVKKEPVTLQQKEVPKQQTKQKKQTKATKETTQDIDSGSSETKITAKIQMTKKKQSAAANILEPSVLRARVKSMALQITDDEEIANSVVEKFFEVQDGKFADSMSDANMPTIGHEIVQKFVKKALKKKRKKKKRDTAAAAAAHLSEEVQGEEAKVSVTPTWNLRQELEKMAQEQTKDSAAVDAAVNHVLTTHEQQLRTADKLFSMKEEVCNLMRPVLDAHRAREEKESMDIASLEEAARQRKKNDEAASNSNSTPRILTSSTEGESDRAAGQARLFARAQADVRKSNTTPETAKNKPSNSIPLPVRSILEPSMLRERVKSMALQITDDEEIANSVVEKFFEYQDGKFVLSMTEENLNTFGKNLVEKKTRKAMKKKTKQQQQKSAAAAAATAPSAVATAPSAVATAPSAAAAAPTLVAKNEMPWVVAEREEDKREQAASTSATFAVQQQSSSAQQFDADFQTDYEPDFEADYDDFLEENLKGEEDDTWYPPSTTSTLRPVAHEFVPMTAATPSITPVAVGGLSTMERTKQQQADVVQESKELPLDVLEPSMLRERVKSMALQITDDEEIANSVVEKFFEYQDGKFVLSMTEENLNTFGKNLVEKKTRKAMKKKTKQQQQKSAAAAAATAPSAVATAPSAVATAPSAAAAAPTLVAKNEMPWVVAEREEDKREQAVKQPTGATTSLASVSSSALTTPPIEYDSILWLRTKCTTGQITTECYTEIADKFQKQKIRTMYQVKLLNYDRLVDLGIVSLGHQMVLLSAIEQYKANDIQSRADFLFDFPNDGDYA